MASLQRTTGPARNIMIITSGMFFILAVVAVSAVGAIGVMVSFLFN